MSPNRYAEKNISPGYYMLDCNTCPLSGSII